MLKLFLLLPGSCAFDRCGRGLDRFLSRLNSAHQSSRDKTGSSTKSTHGDISDSRYLSCNMRFARYDWIAKIMFREKLAANQEAYKPVSKTSL